MNAQQHWNMCQQNYVRCSALWEGELSFCRCIGSFRLQSLMSSNGKDCKSSRDTTSRDTFDSAEHLFNSKWMTEVKSILRQLSKSTAKISSDFPRRRFRAFHTKSIIMNMESFRYLIANDKNKNLSRGFIKRSFPPNHYHSNPQKQFKFLKELHKWIEELLKLYLISFLLNSRFVTIFSWLRKLFKLICVRDKYSKQNSKRKSSRRK